MTIEEMIAELKELETKTTPSKWVADLSAYIWDDHIDMMIAEMRGWGHLTGKLNLSGEQAVEVQNNNALIICAMRNYLPVLLTELERLQAENEQLRSDYDRINDFEKSQCAKLAEVEKERDAAG